MVTRGRLTAKKSLPERQENVGRVTEALTF